MMWLLSYLGSNFGLVIACTIAVIALGAVAWFTRNWKVAVAAAVVLGLGFAYMAIDKAAYQRRVSEEAKAQVVLLQGRLATIQLTNAVYAKRLSEDGARISDLEKQASETPKNDSPCFDADAARRVRAVR